MDRTILHSDMNNFYASVECLKHPEWKTRPIAVGGDADSRHGIVLAKNDLAKRCGVQTAEPIWQARKKCPDILFVPPHFEEYQRYSRLIKEIYCEYTDLVESYGLDECWLDVTASATLFGDGKTIADTLRARIKSELGLTNSVGVSFNKIFAKLGSDLKKPDATTVIPRERFREIVWPLPVESLLYVGKSTRQRFERMFIHTVGDLARSDRELLSRRMGKAGEMLWDYANGIDESPVASIYAQGPPKSIGNSTTTPHDLIAENEVKITLLSLSESVAERMRHAGLRASTVQITIRDNELNTYNRQSKLDPPSCTAQDLFQASLQLYRENHAHGKPIRMLGVRVTGLIPENETQLSLFAQVQHSQKEEKLEHAIDRIRDRYGHTSVQRGMMFTDRELASTELRHDPGEEK